MKKSTTSAVDTKPGRETQVFAVPNVALTKSAFDVEEKVSKQRFHSLAVP